MEKKVYKDKKEKVIDLLLGLIGVPIVFGMTPVLISKLFYSSPFFYNAHYSSGAEGLGGMGGLQVNTASPIGFGVVLLAELAAVIFIGLKRKFIGIGSLISLALAIGAYIILVACFGLRY